VLAAAAAAFGETLRPPFTYQASDINGLLSSFIFEDVGVMSLLPSSPQRLCWPLLSALV